MSDERPKKPGQTRAPWEGEAEALGKTLVTPTPIPRDILKAVDASSYSSAKTADSRPAVVPPIPPASDAGRVVDGRFRLESTLGEGGMGVVYRAVQLSVQRPVALKLLKGEASRDSKMAQRFTREAESISRLSHPNIVTLLDFGNSAEGQLYLAMEFVEGERLTDRILAATRLSPKEAVRIATQILAALEHAHGRGIVHRDLKPSNVMLVNVDGHHNFVKLLDFGVAKLYDELQSGVLLTGSGMVVGTPAYMAPEQALGEHVDGRADVYSAGLLVYEMLAGARPFPDDSTRNTFLAQINQPPPPFGDELRATIPSRVYDAMMKALEKRPENRFQSADEMRRELSGESGAATATRSRASSASGATRAVRGSGSRETLHARGEVVAASKRRWIWAGGVGIGLAAAVVVALIVLPNRGGRQGDPAVPETTSRGAEDPRSLSAARLPVVARVREGFARVFEAARRDEREGASVPRPASAAADAARPSGETPARADARAAVPVPTRPRETRRAATHGTVRVYVYCDREHSKPCWAYVSLDGSTPVQKGVADLKGPFGSRRLIVRKDGFKPVEKRVNLTKPLVKVVVDLERL
ncbi:MAG: serine/threonine protein kinase [Deltaproteobacteria bacterium]|nr:serine/threonine protein kinase [Deltaproteobacteria bacterium]